MVPSIKIRMTAVGVGLVGEIKKLGNVQFERPLDCQMELRETNLGFRREFRTLSYKVESYPNCQKGEEDIF